MLVGFTLCNSLFSINAKWRCAGLFAPRAGQNFRDEQRRRRSQYDRGTRLAEIEDSYDFDPSDHRVNAKNYYGTTDLARNRIAHGMDY